MGYDSVTDQQIASLLSMPKQVLNPNIKVKNKGAHAEFNYMVIGEDEFNISYKFLLYTRQNKIITDDFSCGLIWCIPSGEVITLTRYNGSHHPHSSHLEGGKMEFQCHIHKATEKYIRANKKPEGHAQATFRYNNLPQALKCLLEDCFITGLEVQAQNREVLSYA